MYEFFACEYHDHSMQIESLWYCDRDKQYRIVRRATGILWLTTTNDTDHHLPWYMT